MAGGRERGTEEQQFYLVRVCWGLCVRKQTHGLIHFCAISGHKEKTVRYQLVFCNFLIDRSNSYYLNPFALDFYKALSHP